MPMKKIAVLRCLRTSNNCTGSGCLKAFNNKTNAFAVYEAEETELAAFLNCSAAVMYRCPITRKVCAKSWTALLLSALKPCI